MATQSWKSGLKAALWFIFAVICGLIALFIVVANWPLDPVIWWIVVGAFATIGVQQHFDKQARQAWQRHYEIKGRLKDIEGQVETLKRMVYEQSRETRADPGKNPFSANRL